MENNFDNISFQNKAAGFEDPVQLPANDDTARKWQDANKSWWEKTPMRYDWRESIAIPPCEIAYYDEVDRRFLDAVRHSLPWTRFPFESLIPFDKLKNLDPKIA